MCPKFIPRSELFQIPGLLQTELFSSDSSLSEMEKFPRGTIGVLVVYQFSAHLSFCPCHSYPGDPPSTLNHMQQIPAFFSTTIPFGQIPAALTTVDKGDQSKETCLSYSVVLKSPQYGDENKTGIGWRKVTFFSETAEGSLLSAVQDIRNLADSFLLTEFAHRRFSVYLTKKSVPL